MTAFLVFWITGWTVGCMVMLLQYIGWAASEEPLSIAMLILFWSVDLVVGGFVAYVLLARRHYRLTKTEFVYEVSLFGMRRTTTVERSAIAGLNQVQDGGDGDDSFPGWGLKLARREGSNVRLLFRQPHASSTWLGEVMEAWSGVPLSRAPNEA